MHDAVFGLKSYVGWLQEAKVVHPNRSETLHNIYWYLDVGVANEYEVVPMTEQYLSWSW